MLFDIDTPLNSIGRTLSATLSPLGSESSENDRTERRKSNIAGNIYCSANKLW